MVSRRVARVHERDLLRSEDVAVSGLSGRGRATLRVLLRGDDGGREGDVEEVARHGVLTSW
jgi:predicted ABC-type transport system involved in lysophospholipase L1 biosynthesis ATPase subunit